MRWAIDFTLGFFGGRADRRDEVIARLDVEPLLDAAIGSLSKGQRKRALLAIGLLTPQPVLLADEPFDGLDLRQSRDVARTLRAHAAAGRTMFCRSTRSRRGTRVRSVRAVERRPRRAAKARAGTVGAAAARGSTAGDDLEEVFLALT